VTDDAPLLLDVTRLIWRRWTGRLPTGIDRVCLAYLRHFGERSQAVVQHDRFRRILDRGASQDLFALLSEPKKLRIQLPLRALGHLGGLNCDGQSRIYLNIGHTGLNSAGFRAWVVRSGVRPVYLVHDLIPITHPEYCRAGESDKHRERMRTVLATATGVLGNSQSTLDELSCFARQESLPNPPALAAWLGVDPLPAPKRRAVSERPYFVVIGTIEARKNHRMLLAIWSRLIARLGANAPELRVIGQRGWEAADVFLELDNNQQLHGHVRELNHCLDEELANQLAGAQALLFPSLVEGFGLPLVEALSLHAPVLASDLPVFREIGGNIPTYLDPTDEGGWEAAILDYAQPASKARSAQIALMKGYRVPSWRSHFEAVEAWLPTLA
jgi:glycosyltransferase involved in cell wall biosynthesis